MTTDEERIASWKATGVRVWTAVGVLVLIAAVVWMIGRIVPVLIPFLMAGVIVFLLRAPVGWIQRHGAPRWVAVLTSYVVAIAVLTVALVFIAPVFAEQTAQFLGAFPGYVTQAGKTFAMLTQRYWTPLPLWVREAAANAQASVAAQVGEGAKIAAAELVTAGGSLVTFVVDSVLALFIAFYILVDLPTIRTDLVLLARPRWRGDVEIILHEISIVLTGYLRGQATVAVINGVLTAIGLFIVGIPYSGVIGLITGVLSIVPYIGPVVGAIIVGITGLFISPAKAALGVVVMIAVQQVEGSLISPRIMSREVDLHPALVIFSLLVGAELAGLLGMLVAIPVAATGKALFGHYVGSPDAGEPVDERAVPGSGDG